ncbi:SDR family NAD(P)-dependent oxidoreductase [Amycolatopsis sp. PS_44_ISF1]|uniref:SDR family NAD(P)-dependent oxidoreductase n=1 Tax=Amycolatopsis sp. PS_44_ISF1 TaxID=2974917 RepID=UPI0028E09A01|nr:SDR family NAD(P)-dependent oxidoreductase [Amycolatopsis sp. PS_44_ISF1]MDT8911762.1 SDR family NAD(P)-dependent oxidoreductase [Amycolatopsis sp. PS_44_ISF1]
MSWNPGSPPDLSGRTYAVTGGNSGIGYFISEQLAAAGAHVVILGRDPGRLRTAVDSIRGQSGAAARLSTLPLDLADLDSVASAAEALAGLGRLDALIENAGTTSPGRTRQTTEQGFELALGTNHLGHFALTALAMPVLKATPGSRVVPIGSLISLLVKFDLDDLSSERGYSQFRAYGLSKHAVASFGFELDRRLRASDVDVHCVLAHPGLCLDGASPRREGISEPSPARFSPITQGEHHGAWPAVRAATDPSARGGEYYGPRFAGVGRPVRQRAVAADRDPEKAARLWQLSERLTGVEFTV